MTAPTRRGLFGLLLGASALPYIRSAPAAVVRTTYQRYSGYEVLNVTTSDIISAAEFDWKQAASSVSITRAP